MATRDYETVIYDERDGVAWITLNRPERHNAFNHVTEVVPEGQKVFESGERIEWRGR